MKLVATVFSALLWLLGGLFVLAAMHPEAIAQHKVLPRLMVGGILVVAGFVLLALAWIPRTRAASGGLPGEGGSDLLDRGVPGQLSLKPIVCPHCGGQVDASTATLNPEGTLTVTCGYCKGAFLIQEEPKW